MKRSANIFRKVFGILLVVNAVCSPAVVSAQRPGAGGIKLDGRGRPMGAGNRMPGGDSLQRRNSNEDSITIYFRIFDSSRIHFIDSSIGEFSNRFPLRQDHLFLGSLGNATRSIIFNPLMKPGFDAGFHAYDAYRFTLEETRIFQTTRPYTELDYILGSRSEQTIRALHTQNIKPTWNAAFEYRYLGAPGHFKNNNTSHSNMRLSSGFSGRNRRYSGNFIYIANRNRSATNGGITDPAYLTSTNTAFNQRFNIPTWLGGDGDFGTNFFATNVNTGHEYRQRLLFFRHQYDFGQKDSSINENDSTVTRVFYPRFRLQHTASYETSSYNFQDIRLTDTSSSFPYVQVYRQRLGIPFPAPKITLTDGWKDLTNEAAILIYPQKDNQDQFLKAGAGFQLLQGTFNDSAITARNLYLLGEYRNRTRNRKWEMLANGRFFLTGMYAGNYSMSLSLQRQLGGQTGNLQLYFQNSNRTPAYIYEAGSSYYHKPGTNLRNENWTRIGGQYFLPGLKLQLTGNYYVVSNYTYWNDFSAWRQEATLTSVLHAGVEKTFRLNRHWNWYTSVHAQTETGDVINLPLVFTRNRIAYEGVFFKNLVLSTGLDIRYFTPFKAYDFSPVSGQWVLQDTAVISNLPDVAAYLHFRIRSFRLYARVENLNTLDVSRGFAFLNNNLAGPLYPTPGMLIRFGIYWSFVN